MIALVSSLATLILWVFFSVFSQPSLEAASPPTAEVKKAEALLGDAALTSDEKKFLHEMEFTLLPSLPSAPDFTLPALDGTEFRFSALRGKVVLLTFWATWCPPCIPEVFSRARLKRRLGGFSFEVVDVFIDPKGAQGIPRAVSDFGLSFPVLLDTNGAVFQSLFKGVAIPNSYLIDPHGRILGQRMGNKTDWEQVEMVEIVRSLSRRLAPVEPTVLAKEKSRSGISPGRAEEKLGADHLMEEGNQLYGKRDKTNAVSRWREALGIYRALGERRGEGWALYSLALAREGFFIQFLEESLRIASEIKDAGLEGKVLLEQAAYRLDGANAYRDPNDLLRLKSFLERSLKLLREAGYGKEEVQALTYLGRVHFGLGELRTAVRLYLEAMDRAEKGTFEVEGITAGTHLADVATRTGDYRRAIEIQRIVYGFWAEERLDWNKAGLTLAEMARSYASLGNSRAAVSLYEKALPLLQKAGAKEEANRYAGELGYEYAVLNQWQKAEPYLKGADRVRRATALIFRGKYQEAASLLEKPEEAEKWDSNLRFGRAVALAVAYDYGGRRELAQKYYREAIAMVETEREGLSEEMRGHFFSGRTSIFRRTIPYQGLIRVSNPDEALAHAEALKARQLLEQSARRAAGGRPPIADDLRAEEEAVNREISLILREREAVNQEIAQRQSGTWPPDETLAQKRQRSKELSDRLRELERRLPAARERRAHLIARLYREAPEYASIQYPRTLRAGDVILRPGEVLLEYALSWGSLHAFLLREGKVVHSFSADISTTSLERMVESYRRQISEPERLNDERFDAKTGHQLFTILLKEMLPFIKPQEELVIVPDGKLAFLPFEALPLSAIEPSVEKGRHGPYPAGLSWVGDHYRIRYAFSASSLTQKRLFGKEPEAGGLLVVADPIFEEQDERLGGQGGAGKKKQPEGRSLLMRAVEEAGQIGLPRLEETGRLGRNLQQLLAGERSDLLMGAAAIKNNIVKRDLRRYRYVVFATHGLLGGQIPGIQEPALALSWTGGARQEEFLTLSEVMRLRLNADVVALTACQTGLGEEVAGEGVMGMGRAFQFAGAKSVLVSLWSVAEASTTLLVEKFFAHLRRGENKISALRKARGEIKEAGYKHPFYWAPFILIGE